MPTNDSPPGPIETLAPMEAQRAAESLPASPGVIFPTEESAADLRRLLSAGDALAVACRRWDAARTTGHEYDVLDALWEYDVAREKWEHPVRTVHLRPGSDGFMRCVDVEFEGMRKRTGHGNGFRVDL